MATLRGLADMGYAAVLPRVVGVPRARDLLLTGRTLSAREALDWGLVTRVVDHDRLYPTTVEVVRALTAAAPNASTAVRRALHEVFGHVDRGTMDRSLASDECEEGFRSFKERRSPAWSVGPEAAPLPPWSQTPSPTENP